MCYKFPHHGGGFMNKLLLALVLIGPMTCFAANWVEVNNNENISTEVDKSSIQKLSKGKRLAWIRTVQKVDGKTVSSVVRVEVDCVKQTLANKDLYIKSNEDVIYQNNEISGKPFTPVLDSDGWLSIKAICKAP